MAKLELNVALDHYRVRYAPGDVISGQVHVRPNAAVQCNGLKVALQWFTHGKGNRQNGDMDAENLFIGQWQMGQALSYPFRLDVPAWPRGYAGELLNIGFRVHATADIPWAIDPQAEQIVDIVHEAPRGMHISWNEAKHDASRSKGGCLAASATLLVVALVFGLLGLSESDLFGLAFTCLLVGLIGVGTSLSKYLADRRLGRVAIAIQQRSQGGYRDPQRPDTLHVSLQQARADAETTGATAALDIREQVVRGSGTNKTTHTHPLYHRAVDLTRTAPGRYEGDVELPLANLPPSFYATDNKIIWELKLEIDVPGAAHWEEIVKLTARPVEPAA